VQTQQTATLRTFEIVDVTMVAGGGNQKIINPQSIIICLFLHEIVMPHSEENGDAIIMFCIHGFDKNMKFYKQADSGFGGLEVACWPLLPKFAGLHPAEAFGFLGRKKSSARLPLEEK
jgi:hypothetical protein